MDRNSVVYEVQGFCVQGLRCLATEHILVVFKNVSSFIPDVLLLLIVWLMPVMAPASVVHRHHHQRRHLEDFDEVQPCQEYTLDDLLYLDCSDKGLSELPGTVNFNVSLVF